MSKNTENQIPDTSYAVIDIIGEPSNLSVQHLVAISDNELTTEQEDQLRNGQSIDNVFSYPPGYYYTITPDLEAQDFDHERYFETHLHFQDGSVPVEGINGLTNEALLEVLIHRMNILDAKFPCKENKIALKHMQLALSAFKDRSLSRKLRGVEGKNVI
ncbi:hypothetical protein GCM10023206_07090 [Acinetobacter puyangensis]|uniref:Uncharacterized protein n=1 Tax=Acinetobacter puyangensis TaxID=1096779 RepID=A0A240E6S8_9GAMM|nr:hypothetical protein [Acinetobacter puyangensis]SNX44211.1 hypothetical protein SAMN05421731_102372 [Acinetobacter puyangensis]